MSNTLSHRPLHRAGMSSPVSKQERWSADFVVDGRSLLRELASADADLMGCFVRGFPDQNLAKLAALLGTKDPDTEDGRVLVYICPECGDIGCGAYALRIERAADTVRWFDFAYVNGYEEPVPVNLSPLEFDAKEYEQAVTAACAI